MQQLWRRIRPIWRQPSPSPPEPKYDPAHEPAPLGDVIQRGQAAHRLLNDPTLAEAFAALRLEAIQSFADSPPGEPVRREEAYRMLQALELVRGKLITYRSAARIRETEATLARQEKEPERL